MGGRGREGGGGGKDRTCANTNMTSSVMKEEQDMGVPPKARRVDEDGGKGWEEGMRGRVGRSGGREVVVGGRQAVGAAGGGVDVCGCVGVGR